MKKKIFITILTVLCLLDAGLFLFIRNNYRNYLDNPLEHNAFIPALLPVHLSKVRSGSVAKEEISTQTIHLRAVGDIMLGRSVAAQSEKYGNWRWPFQQIVPYLVPTDLFIGNLEAPIVAACPFARDGMIFCAPPRVVDGLHYANLDVVSLANNHSLNHGSDGLLETEAILSAADIRHLRQNESTLIERNNMRLGLVAFDDVTYPVTLEKISHAVVPIASQSAVIIGMIHWGNEYQATPSARQRQVAQWLHQAGVPIIIGDHPHILQPIEASTTSLTAYSLGNFVFDQMWSESTRRSEILELELTFIDKKLQSIKYNTIPIKIYDYGQPKIE